MAKEPQPPEKDAPDTKVNPDPQTGSNPPASDKGAGGEEKANPVTRK